MLSSNELVFSWFRSLNNNGVSDRPPPNDFIPDDEFKTQSIISGNFKWLYTFESRLWIAIGHQMVSSCKWKRYQIGFFCFDFNWKLCFNMLSYIASNKIVTFIGLPQSSIIHSPYHIWDNHTCVKYFNQMNRLDYARVVFIWKTWIGWSSDCEVMAANYAKVCLAKFCICNRFMNHIPCHFQSKLMRLLTQSHSTTIVNSMIILKIANKFNKTNHFICWWYACDSISNYIRCKNFNKTKIEIHPTGKM